MRLLYFLIIPSFKLATQNKNEKYFLFSLQLSASVIRKSLRKITVEGLDMSFSFNFSSGKRVWSAFPAIFFSMIALSGCGGGGGGSSYNSGGDNQYPTSSMAATSSSMPSSSSSSSEAATSSSGSVSSVLSSSSASSVAVDASPITDGNTAMGEVFVAKGGVNILLNNNNVVSVAAQNRAGMTLYIFDKDTVGASNCTSVQCMTNWPPLVADDNAVAEEPLTIITRGDGHKQWALRDKPLYFFVGDAAAGDVKGEGVAGVWHVAGYVPVQMSQSSLNAADGDYLVASGKVLVGMPTDSSNTAFVSNYLDRDAFSLYTFDSDTSGVSNCNGGCLAAWPPLLADDDDEASAPYSIITRAMGTNPAAKQWAYHGMPLYFYIGDTAAGQTTGKALPKWHLARRLPVKEATSTTLGSYLAAYGLVKTATTVNATEEISTNPKDGFALYTFDNDTAGTSNCSGSCLVNWPALMADDGAVAQAPYSLVARASGKFQWALNGMPLYFFSADTAAGNTKGDGVNGVWHLARTAPVIAKQHSSGTLFIAHGNLVTANGSPDTVHQNFTLYTFDQDTPGVTTCFNGCLTVWPALYAAANAKASGDFTLVVRDANTGVKQWAYKGKPLYFYVGDSAAGDVTGEYTDWRIARP